jgi:hypothetical protein
MGILDRFFGKKSAPLGDGKAPRFVRKEETPGAIYEIYAADDAETARRFLLTKQVDQEKYYVMVETPEGTWGVDKLGLYLERLLPFQTDLSAAGCDGRTCSMPDPAGLEMAANGLNESFVIKVQCGKCQREWTDAVRYQNVTVVRCPGCKMLCKIDTSNIHRVVTVHYPLFERFIDGLDGEERQKAMSAMSAVSLAHEILAIYGTEEGFSDAMELAQRLADRFHPIARRLSDGGIVYIRCHFFSVKEFGEVLAKFRGKGDRVRLYSRPEEAEVALRGSVGA